MLWGINFYLLERLAERVKIVLCDLNCWNFYIFDVMGNLALGSQMFLQQQL